MPTDRDQHLRELFLFLAAADLPREERAAYLRQQCAGDATLQADVVHLLEDFLVPPSVPGTRSESALDDILARLSSHTAPRSRYRLQGEIARGGMGAIHKVYDETLSRHLAMKVMLGQGYATPGCNKPDVDPRSLGRFLDEAQVTAQLDHPGVPPVHDLGLDAQGRVFFTMKLVRGNSLQEIFELVKGGDDEWSTTRVLGVLLKVCEAMAYAHSKGVIHRDLKPANVMVGRFGEVYVMDWGLARILGQEDTKDIRIRAEMPVTSELRSARRKQVPEAPDSPLLTMDGDVLGTPAYMSPEQARGDLEAVGPATDVYALGAMLYHLLSERMPYVTPGARVNAHALWQLVQMGPPQPIGALAEEVPAELVAICEKAMAREAGGRYEDVLELADDLRAHLEGRVVRAYEAGLRAETRKWFRRNKALALTGVGLVAVILAGLAGLAYTNTIALVTIVVITLAALTTITYVNHASKRRIVGLLSTLYDIDDDSRTSHPTKMAELLLARASKLVHDDLGKEPLLQSRILASIGSIYQSLGRYGSAAPLLEEALSIRRNGGAAMNLEMLKSIQSLAQLFTTQSRFPEAEELYREALDGFRASLGPNHPETIQALLGFAETYYSQDKFGQAENLTREALEGSRRTLGEGHVDTLRATMQLARICSDLDRFDEAERLSTGAVERSEREHGAERPITLTCRMRLAAVYQDHRRFDEADSAYIGLLADYRRYFGEDHPDTLQLRQAQAMLSTHRGKPADAAPLMRQVLADTERVLGAGHLHTLECQNELAITLENLKQYEEAIALKEDLIHRYEALLGSAHYSTIVVRGNLGAAYLKVGRYEEAESLIIACAEGLRRIFGDRHWLFLRTQHRLANVHLALGQLARAESTVTGLHRTLIELHGMDHPPALDAQALLACILWKQDRFDEARKLADDLVQRMPPDDQRRSGRLELLRDIEAADSRPGCSSE